MHCCPCRARRLAEEMGAMQSSNSVSPVRNNGVSRAQCLRLCDGVYVCSCLYGSNSTTTASSVQLQKFTLQGLHKYGQLLTGAICRNGNGQPQSWRSRILLHTTLSCYGLWMIPDTTYAIGSTATGRCHVTATCAIFR